MHYYPPHDGGYDQRERDETFSIASLQKQLIATSKEIAQATEKISNVNAENNELKRANAELQSKLESTRDALRETRDSLEQVQVAIKPLNLAQKAKEQQLQQLTQMNRLYEAKITDFETKFRQAELTIKRHMQQSESKAGDEALIEKLHERLISSQNALLKCQSDLQRLQVTTASSNSELAEARRSQQALEVQLLVQEQSHQQTLQAMGEQATAKENSLMVELSSCKRRLVVLEEQLQLQITLREASRKEEEEMQNAALSKEIKAAMNKITAREEQRAIMGQLQSMQSTNPNPELLSSIAYASSSTSSSATSPSSHKASPTSSKDSLLTHTVSSAMKVEAAKKSFFSGRGMGFLTQGFNKGSSPSDKPSNGPNTTSKIVSVGEGSMRVDQIINVDEADGEYDGSQGSPVSSDEINMPVFFRPLNDITEEVNQLEKDKGKTVQAIKEWTDNFVKVNHRDPSSADIAASKAVSALYDEMEEISADLKKNVQEMAKTMQQLSKLESLSSP